MIGSTRAALPEMAGHTGSQANIDTTPAVLALPRGCVSPGSNTCSDDFKCRKLLELNRLSNNLTWL